MIDILNSVSLRSIIPKSQTINFDRDRVEESEAEVKMEVSTVLAKSDNTENSCKLEFSVKAEAKNNDDSIIFQIVIVSDYFFEIVDRTVFDGLSDEESCKLCSNLVYLDFRRRLIISMTNLGMQGIKIPYSLKDFMDTM
jgi:preprotein translocase subunit SecB